MNIEFSKSNDKILDGEGKENLWKRNTTMSRMSKWEEKQNLYTREQMSLKGFLEYWKPKIHFTKSFLV